jgi:hypothetical protein
MFEIDLEYEAARRNLNRCFHYIVGASIGEASEPTAFSVIEQRTVRSMGWGADTEAINLRQLQRLPLSTSHTDFVRYLVRDLMPNLSKLDQAGGGPTLVVDVNATGSAVADLMVKQGLSPIRVSISAAAGETQDSENWNVWRVGRPDLVGILQLAMQSRRLQAAADLELLPILATELQNFKLRPPTVRENDLASLRDTKYADLVFAVGLGVWRAERDTPQPQSVIDHWTAKINDPKNFKWIV